MKNVLGIDALDIPVTPVLCFVGAEWNLFARPFELDGIVVAWPKAVTTLITQPGVLDGPAIERTAHSLAGLLVRPE